MCIRLYPIGILTDVHNNIVKSFKEVSAKVMKRNEKPPLGGIFIGSAKNSKGR